jgi:ATP-dependent RNA helicase DHX8/PRP22
MASEPARGGAPPPAAAAAPPRQKRRRPPAASDEDLQATRSVLEPLNRAPRRRRGAHCPAAAAHTAPPPPRRSTHSPQLTKPHTTTAAAATRRARLEPGRRALPVFAARAALLALVRAAPVTVLVGETGSGKTTQVPRLLLEAGLAGAAGAVACTQPRRVAATAVAARVASEMGVRLGGLVGYSVRFDDCSSEETRIKYVTDGMLVREALADPLLLKYGVVVVDEAHERTVPTDVLLGLLKRAAAARAGGGSGGGDAGGAPLPPLKLLVMSATLDAGPFLRFFPGAAAARVRGRAHPVRVLYTAAPQDSYLDAAVAAALQVHADEPPGDILVFLTGQDEIEAAERLLADRAAALAAGGAEAERPRQPSSTADPADADADAEPRPTSMLILPMYAALPPEAQAAVFLPAPPGTRKVVLATNVAETSITIPGVRYVVDCGMVKARAFAPRLGADVLEVAPVSQAQARQRSGRAGREGPGACFRLYTEDAFRALAPATEPEIRRANLASTVLQLKALGVDDVLSFDFVDAPPRAALLRALELLLALGALEPATGALTEPLGHQLARLPVDPMYGKALLASGALGCAEDVLAAVAIVSADAGVFHAPRGAREAAAAAHARFRRPSGDHATLLAAYRGWAAAAPRERGRWCRDNFLNVRALRRAGDVAAQLRRQLAELGVPLRSAVAEAAAAAAALGGAEAAAAAAEAEEPLRRALAAGLFPHAARRQPGGGYRVIATGQEVQLHPSSALLSTRGGAGGGGARGVDGRAACVVFSELVKTKRQYARVATAVEPSWLAEAAPAFFARRAANREAPALVELGAAAARPAEARVGGGAAAAGGAFVPNGVGPRARGPGRPLR